MFGRSSMIAFLFLTFMNVMSSAELHLYVASNVTEKLLPKIIKSYSVRGHYDDLVVVVKDSEIPLPIEVHDLGVFNSTEHYVILEHQELDFSYEFAAQKKWYSHVVNILREFEEKILFSTPKRILTRISRENALNVLPINTAYLPLLNQSIAPQSPSVLLSTLEKVRNLKEPDPQIVKILDKVTADYALEVLNYLSGVTSDIDSRNSIHPKALEAANWLEKQYASYGFQTYQDKFRSDYCPNVIATLRGKTDPDRVVVVGAHYDSRGAARSSATAKAPGANDDGSGTSMLLQLARIIYELGMQFRYTLILGSWGGEEQGLVGSRAYAQRVKKEGMDIIAMFQADMIAYRKPGEGLQCGFPNRYHDVILTDLAKEVMSIYTPEVQTCTTTACCSDHQSFYEQGYSSTQFFERCGSIADDKYHNIGDIVDRTGFEIQDELIPVSKGVIASVAYIAEPLE